jgi:hypothetical protein
VKTPALSVSLRQDGGLYEGAGRKGTLSSIQGTRLVSLQFPCGTPAKAMAGMEKPPLHFSLGNEGVGRSGGSCRYDVVGSGLGIAPHQDEE